MGLGYRYDGAGNVVRLCRDSGGGECLQASLPSARTRVMSYDAADRLQVADWQAPGGFGQLAYDFDALGNIQFKHGGAAGDTGYTYDDRGRLSAATGNVGDLRPISLTWNKAGLLASTSTGEAYWYDAMGRRVVKYDGSVTYYHHDAAGRVIAETDQEGRLAHEYYYLGNKLLATHGCSSGVPGSCTVETEWYQTDMLGSVLARSDAATTPSVQGFDYLPWGEQFVAPPPSLQGDRQYNGRVFDTGTGFHDYGARMYWPEIGRFISADSYQGRIEEPASLNRYSYVLNNPYKYVDPTGHWDVFAQAEIDLVGISGVEFGAGVVFDSDSPMDSGIFVVGGHAGGANVGAGVGLGWVARDIEGASLNLDVNVKAVSLVPTADDKGLNGFAVSVGPGIGVSVSGTETKTLTVRDMVKFVKGLFSDEAAPPPPGRQSPGSRPAPVDDQRPAWRPAPPQQPKPSDERREGK